MNPDMNYNAMPALSAKEFAMRCTAMVLSVMVFTSACRAADTPPPAPPSPVKPPTSQPSASNFSREAQQQSNDFSPRARKGGGGGGGGFGAQNGVVYDGAGGDGNNPWMMIRPRSTSRPT